MMDHHGGIQKINTTKSTLEECGCTVEWLLIIFSVGILVFGVISQPSSDVLSQAPFLLVSIIELIDNINVSDFLYM